MNNVLDYFSFSQFLLCGSLILFFIEVVIFLYIKKISKHVQSTDMVVDHSLLFLAVLKPSHVFVYVSIYVMVLFFAKMWAIIFIFIYGFQLFSLVIDSIFLTKLFKEQ